MIAAKQIRLVMSLMFGCISVPALSAEPNQPVIELRFVTAEPWVVQSNERPLIAPSYAACFTVQWRFEPTGEPNAEDLLKTSAGKTLSALQRELIKMERSSWLGFTLSTTSMSRHDMPFGSTTYTAMAVSKDDAKRMAYALVQFLVTDEKASTRRMKKNHIERLSGMQEGLRKKIEEAQEEIEAKGNEVPAAYQKYKDAVRNSPYSLHPSSQIPEEVRKTIFEMDKMLDVLNIEIAGIQSKLATIKKYSAQNDVLNSEILTTTLREMAIREEIELVGAESRRQAITGVKRREEALYSQYKAFSDLKSEIATLEGNVKKNEKELRRLEQDIDFLGPGEHTFITEGTAGRNEVVLQEVHLIKPQPPY